MFAIAHHKHIGMAIAAQHGTDRNHQTRAPPDQNPALHIRARLHLLGLRQIHIGGAGAGAAVHAGRDGAHAAVHTAAVQNHVLPHPHLRQLRFGQIGTPLQPVLPNQPQQFAAGSHHLPGLHQPFGNQAGIGRTQFGIAAAQCGGIAHGAGGAQLRLGLRACGTQLIQIGGTDVVALHQRLPTRVFRTRQLGAGLRLLHVRIRLR